MVAEFKPVVPLHALGPLPLPLACKQSTLWLLRTPIPVEVRHRLAKRSPLSARMAQRGIMHQLVRSSPQESILLHPAVH